MTNTPPGALFAGILRAPMRAFLRDVLEGARGRGYNRLVEPAAGPFTACQLAIQAGWRPEQLEASDISFFSAVLGKALNGESIEDLDIDLPGYEYSLASPADAMFAEVYARIQKQHEGKPQIGSWFYWRSLLDDMDRRREWHLDEINKTIAKMRTPLQGLSYRALDMFEHIAEAEADPHAIIVLAPPTYRGGYEKIEDTGGRLKWTSPAYTMFDPSTGIAALGERMKQSAALWLMYLESETQEQELPAVFAHGLVRAAKGVAARTMNAYLVSNRPDEIAELAQPAAVHWSPKLAPPTLPLLPKDHPISRKSRLTVKNIGPEGDYWRLLWLHNFRTIAGRAEAAGIFVDGYLAGIFGYDYETKGGRMALLTYHVGIPGDGRLRWQRVVMRAAMCSETIHQLFDDLRGGEIAEVRTTMFSQHPVSMAARGLMKLLERKPDKRRGFHLSYSAPVNQATLQEVWRQAWDDDERWKRRRDDGTAA